MLVFVVGLLASCDGASTNTLTPIGTTEPASIEHPPDEPTPASTTATDPPQYEKNVIAALNGMIIPIDSIEPGNETNDLGPLVEMFGDARIIGLGEGTHGTSEFVTIRHRIIRLLVEEFGLTLIALEAPWAGIEIANGFVQGEHENEAAAQDGLSYFMFQNEEFWDLILWLREYNRDVDPAERIQLAGIDPQGWTDETTEVILDYIQSVDAEALGEFERRYQEIGDGGSGAEGLDDSEAAFNILERRRARYTSNSSEAQFERALFAARLILQNEQLLRAGRVDRSILRDKFMADNVELMVDGAQSGQRAVLWSHNGHVSKEHFSGVARAISLGGHLDSRYGEDYFALGFDFAAGSFLARTSGEDVSAPLDTFKVELAPEHTYAHLFSRLDQEVFALDLQAENASSDVKDWLATPRGMRSVGCCHAPYSDPVLIVTLSPSFDSLVFVSQTTAVSPLRQ